MRPIAKIEIEQGKDALPTLMRVQFDIMTWNFAMRIEGALWTELDEKRRSLELRRCIDSALDLIRQEMRKAAKEQTGINV